MENKSGAPNDSGVARDFKLDTFSHSPNTRRLVNSLTSHINLKLREGCKTFEKLIEIHNELRTLQRYYRLIKESQKDFKIKKFRLLLAKYIEREHDVLYQETVDTHREAEAYHRILKIVEGFLLEFNNKPSFRTNKEQTAFVKTRMLKLLKLIQPSYFTKYKLLNNVAQNVIENFKQKITTLHPIQSYVTTSDYGTDDSESDVEREDIWKRNQTHSFTLEPDRKNDVLEADDCVMISCNLKEKPQKLIATEKPIVTFEILDDDENGDTNYMIYMHQEVHSKRNIQKFSWKTELPEITILSDSEDERSSNNKEKKCDSGLFNTNGLRTSCKKINLPIAPKQHDDQKKKTNDLMKSVNSVVSYETCDKELSDRFSSDNDPVLSQNIPEEHLDLLVIQSTDIFFEETHGTIDPTTLFKDPERVILNKSNYYDSTESLLLNDNSNVSEINDIYSLDNDLNRTVDSLNLQSYRINDSLLEEFLLDDSYLLLGRKELEEFEYFLFNDNQENSGLSNLSLDCDEHAKHSDIFNKDIKSIEAAICETSFDYISMGQKMGVQKIAEEQGKRKFFDLQNTSESQNKKVCENEVFENLLENLTDNIR